MNKQELIDEIASKTGLSKADSSRSVDCLVDIIRKAICDDDPVTLIGFGTFGLVDRKATKKRNPKTGAEIDVPAKQVAKFKPSKSLNDSLNE